MSGGEQQQLAIGRALIGNPTLMMLDEPSEGIQPSIVQQICEALKSFRKELGTTILFVEQNLDTILAIAQRCYVMEKGKITRSLAGRTSTRTVCARSCCCDAKAAGRITMLKISAVDKTGQREESNMDLGLERRQGSRHGRHQGDRPRHRRNLAAEGADVAICARNQADVDGAVAASGQGRQGEAAWSTFRTGRRCKAWVAEARETRRPRHRRRQCQRAGDPADEENWRRASTRT